MSGDDAELRQDRRRIGRGWLNHATEDLRIARVCMDVTPPSLGTAAYLCQQAAEKAVKGMLVMVDVPFTKTHDLQRLGTLAAAHYPQCAAALRAIHRFTAWNFVFRYPEFDDNLEPSLGELAAAMAPIESLLQVLAEAVTDTSR
jgi:hypothetical protein